MCCQMSLNGVSPGPDPGHAFLIGASQGWCCALFSTSTSQHTLYVSIRVTTAGINLDHLVMLVCARFLHHNDIIFLFVTDYHSMGTYSEIMPILCTSSNCHPPTFECLNQHLPGSMTTGPPYPMTTTMAAKWWSSISIILFTYSFDFTLM